jgi:uncharacterized protein (DUF58 family)
LTNRRIDESTKSPEFLMSAARRVRPRRPVRFRLTVTGWVFIAGAVLVGVVAVNSRLALLFVMFGCMLGGLYVSAVMARRMTASVQVIRDAPQRCRQHRPAALSYLLRSVRGGGACLALRVQERPDGPAETIAPAHCGYLPAGEGLRIHCELVPSRRGRIRLGSLGLSTAFPFGLVAARRRFDQSATLIVWPARGRLTAPLLTGGQAECAAAAPSVRPGGQDEFHGLREYRAGDNPRWIHWRRSAGRDKPVIREMVPPQPKTLWVVLDAHLGDESPEASQTRERAIRFAATLVEDALADGYRVGMALACGEKVAVLSPGSRRTQRTRLLDALADVAPATPWRLADVLARLHSSLVREAHVVVVDLGAGEASSAGHALARLRRASRSLTVLAGGRLDEVFADEGARGVAAPAAPDAGPPAPEQARDAEAEPCP